MVSPPLPIPLSWPLIFMFPFTFPISLNHLFALNPTIRLRGGGKSRSAEMLQGLERHPTVSGVQQGTIFTEADLAEFDVVLFAKCCFDTKEFERAADVLKNCQSDRAVFLRLYSKYLVRSIRCSWIPSSRPWWTSSGPLPLG